MYNNQRKSTFDMKSFRMGFKEFLAPKYFILRTSRDEFMHRLRTFCAFSYLSTCKGAVLWLTFSVNFYAIGGRLYQASFFWALRYVVHSALSSMFGVYHSPPQIRDRADGKTTLHYVTKHDLLIKRDAILVLLQNKHKNIGWHHTQESYGITVFSK